MFLSLEQNQLSGSVPPNFGRLANLHYLTLNNNPLSGPLPTELMSLPLDTFYFQNTDLCEPRDAAFRSWLASIPTLGRTGVRCSDICNSVSEISPAECKALAAFYDASGGDNWINHTGWLTTTTPCSWYGVMCNGGYVTQLDLHGNQLSGSISPKLGDLISLEYLILHNNQLTGSIPPELGSRTGLQALWLFSNQLSGSIPPALGNLASLRELYLHNNQLSGSIPPELGNLSNVQYLGLSDNPLGGTIPPALGSLANLHSST